MERALAAISCCSWIQVKAVEDVRLKVNPYLPNSGQPPRMQLAGVGELQQSLRPNSLFASVHCGTRCPKNSITIFALLALHHMPVNWGRSITSRSPWASGEEADTDPTIHFWLSFSVMQSQV